MRNFRALVRAHVAPLTLAPREQKIVEEWAAQLEDIYDALRADGLSDDEAWSDIHGRSVDPAERSAAWRRPRRRVAAADAASHRRPRGGAEGGTAPQEALATGLARDLRERSPARQESWLQRHGRPHAGDLPRRQRRDLHGRPRRAVAAAPFADPDRIVGMGDIYPTITPNDILSNDTPSFRPAGGADDARGTGPLHVRSATH